MINGNIDYLSELLVNDIIIPHVSGSNLTKQEWLEYVSTDECDYQSISIESPTVTITDNRAIVEYKSIIEGVFYDYQSSWTMLKKEEFTKINQKWLLAKIKNPIIY